MFDSMTDDFHGDCTADHLDIGQSHSGTQPSHQPWLVLVENYK